MLFGLFVMDEEAKTLEPAGQKTLCLLFRFADFSSFSCRESEYHDAANYKRLGVAQEHGGGCGFVLSRC